jgi:hypothetical protein
VRGGELMGNNSLIGIGSGGIHKLNGVQAIGAEVTLTSIDSSITITPNNTNKTVDLSAAGGSGENFSYNVIAGSTTITIPIDQQMLVYQEENVMGDLIIHGELVVI